jgi:UDPglucose 6-dehydrogenase
MRVSIIGAGHVGLVTGACFAQRGHEVLCADVDAGRVESLRAGRLPFFEPGLGPLAEAGRTSGRLRFCSRASEAVEFGTVIFICVPTPADLDGRADLSSVEAVTREIAASIRSYRLIVEKSTVPVNTGERVRLLLARSAPPGAEFEVASNPEFLREGSAVSDALNPDRIVIGVESARAEGLLRELYASFEAPMLITDTRSAEMIKHASNSFLAFKISYINAVAAVCEKAGANVSDVARGMGMDRRIGCQFLQPGIGYGGSCFPKDVAAFGAIAEDLGYDFGMLREVQRINGEAQSRFLDKVRSELLVVEGKTVAALGLSFKPNTDDLRESVSVALARRIQELGASLRAYDPRANGHAKAMLPGATLCPSAYDAARGADCALILTEWEEFRSLDLDRLRSVMARPSIIDGRNLLDPKEVRARGFVYRSVGRP